MSLNINHITVSGNLTRDPESRYIAGDKVIANFTIANNRKYKGKDGQMVEEVSYIDVEAWGQTAEIAGKYLTKGRACAVEGRIKQDNWDDKATGQKRSKLKIVADKIHFLGDAKADRQEHDAAPVAAAPTVPRASAGGPDEDAPPF
jgi:single-strand DNA-binding protein